MNPCFTQLTRTGLILLAIGLSPAAIASGSTLEFIEPWIAEAPPVSRVMAAYMTIKNTSDSEQTITGATSSCFKRVEFHRTVHEGGMAKMVAQPELTIAATGSITLERGGLHMMLFNPVKPLTAGDRCTFEMVTAENKTHTVDVAVVKAGGGEHDHQHHDHH